MSGSSSSIISSWDEFCHINGMCMHVYVRVRDFVQIILNLQPNWARNYTGKSWQVPYDHGGFNDLCLW